MAMAAVSVTSDDIARPPVNSSKPIHWGCGSASASICPNGIDRLMCIIIGTSGFPF